METDEGILLDFQNADIRLVLSALSEAGGFNLVYGNLPARAVTLRMNQPLARSDLLTLLRTLATSNGLRVVEENGLIRVEAESATPDRRGPRTQEVQEPAQQQRLFVYRLRHAHAPRLAQTLMSLFGGSPRGQLSTGAGPAAGSARTQRIPPVRLDEEPRVEVQLGQVRAAALPGQLTGPVQIVPDELTNALLIRANPADYEVIRQAIEALDLRPLQALIEVLILEVRRDRNREVGVSLGRIDSLSPAVADRVDATLQAATGGDFQLTVRRLGNWPIDAAISLLSASGNVRILSRPVILAQNNQEARILVGSERPFVQVFRSLPTDAAIRDQIVQYRDVGTALTITPTINPDGYINLDVLQEVSTATSETQFGAPVISTREASTRLFVRDGQSVVIGGLIDEQEDRSRTGIPILKDIPVLGYLFGTTRERRIQSELFLFLTPHIIATDEDVERAREDVEETTRLLPDLPPSVINTRPLPAPDTVQPDTVPPSGADRQSTRP